MKLTLIGIFKGQSENCVVGPFSLDCKTTGHRFFVMITEDEVVVAVAVPVPAMVVVGMAKGKEVLLFGVWKVGVKDGYFRENLNLII